MIPLYKTFYPENLGSRLQKVFDSGMTTEGPEAAAFQVELRQWMNNPHVALMNSGTMALEIAGRLAGVEPGDEVIASPVTCAAGLEWILKVGAKPVWCDINPDTGCLDASRIKALITSRTKAITFVDWAGIPAELEAIQAIADNYGLKTIEDAAQSMGATYKGEKVGKICNYTIHSFQSIKVLSTVDGGCLACKNNQDTERAILLRWFGLARGSTSHPVCWTGDITEPGWKGHMNDINAAIGREQLKYVDKHIEQHRRNATYLISALEDLAPRLLTPKVPSYINPLYWVLTVRFLDKEHRARVSEELVKAGIGNNLSHIRNDKYGLFRDFQRDLPSVDDYENRRLNIPCGWWCSQEDIDYIANTLRRVV